MTLEGFQPINNVPIYSDIETCLQKVEADVLIDLTTPEVGMHHAKTALTIMSDQLSGQQGFQKGIRRIRRHLQ